MTAKITSAADIRTFVKAGNAYFTLVSTKTQTRFTYRIRQPENMDPNKPVWFVSLLNGPDNTSNYQYMGAFFQNSLWFNVGAKSRITADAPSARAIKWFLDRILNPMSNDESLAQVEVWHSDRCGRCGKALTVPESIASGLGPDCRAKMGFKAEAVATPIAPKAKAPKKSAYGKVGDPFPFDDAIPFGNVA
jgi:hypothetical protein